jgi:hypothetical protein
MNKGLENGIILGSSKGVYNGIHSGLQGFTTPNKWNMLDPITITDPKIKPVFYINGDNVTSTLGVISSAQNLIYKTSNELLTTVENIFDQSTTSYKPTLVKNNLGGKNIIDFTDGANSKSLFSSVAIGTYIYANTSPQISGTGMTYIFVIKRQPGATRTILDGRDSSFSSTVNDLTLEVNNAGAITFDYKGGTGGSVTSFIGTAGINLLNDWSILTVKAQLRNDGGFIGTDGSAIGASPVTKRYIAPINARIGSLSPLDIYVNGKEQYKNMTTNTFTNADYFNDSSFRMFDRDIIIGNKASGFSTSGTYIAAALMIPAYISNAVQTKIENYFRFYYNRPF